jgi:hypothetical protein
MGGFIPAPPFTPATITTILWEEVRKVFLMETPRMSKL